MKITEIESKVAQQQVKTLKASAEAAKNRAKQLKAQADVADSQAKLKQARDQQTLVRKAVATRSSPATHHPFE